MYRNVVAYRHSLLLTAALASGDLDPRRVRFSLIDLISRAQSKVLGEGWKQVQDSEGAEMNLSFPSLWQAIQSSEKVDKETNLLINQCLQDLPEPPHTSQVVLAPVVDEQLQRHHHHHHQAFIVPQTPTNTPNVTPITTPRSPSTSPFGTPSVTPRGSEDSDRKVYEGSSNTVISSDVSLSPASVSANNHESTSLLRLQVTPTTTATVFSSHSDSNPLKTDNLPAISIQMPSPEPKTDKLGSARLAPPQDMDDLINMVMIHVGCDQQKAIVALEENKYDVGAAIIALAMQ